MELLITKVAEGLFSFEFDGSVMAGSNVRLWTTPNTVCVGFGYTEATNLRVPYENVQYNNGSETIGFASAIEVLSTLKAEGFTGNFNGGRSAPKTAILFLTQGDSNPPTIVSQDINTIGELGTSYSSSGRYLITSSGLFTAGKTVLSTSVDANNGLVGWTWLDESNIVIICNGGDDSLNSIIKIEVHV